jgi:protein involved in polysaccharide export with SLBB domain
MTTIYSGLRGGAASANTFLDVSLGKLKTIQVYVLGEVVRPGGYALSSMSTAMNAMFAAGGPTAEGTLRNVRIERIGDSSTTVDLYGYLLKGDTPSGLSLQDGDIVFVKPAGKRVAVVGQVVRPAIYEVKDGETLGDAISFAGGFRFNAYIDRLHIERVIPFDQRNSYSRNVMDFDVRFKSASEVLSSRERLEDGDIVKVFRVGNLPQNRVIISGSINKPGVFELLPGMRIRDLIMAADSLKRSTFAERGTLFRVLPNLRWEISGFDPRLALEGREEDNILLRNEDSVVVYPDSLFFPEHPVTIKGAVRHPGTFVRNDNMSISDLVVMAGGLTEGASTTGWEISRMDTTQLGVYSKIFKVDMDKEYWNDRKNEKTPLEDFDVVFVPTDPKYTVQKSVKLTGYVMFPGSYAIRYEGERLADVFKRAGGIRKGAYLEGARLIRKFNNAGLIPIDFTQAIDDPESRDNVVLYDGDSIHVAYIEDIVYVSGEVYVPSPVLYKEDAGLGYYIRQAGGYKEEAEEGRTVVFLPGGKKWEGGDILPGSSIFVPKKIEKPDTTLPIIRDLATILASLAAITVALIQVTK